MNSSVIRGEVRIIRLQLMQLTCRTFAALDRAEQRVFKDFCPLGRLFVGEVCACIRPASELLVQRAKGE